MARVSLPNPEEMSAEQRAVYNEIVSGRRGRLVGPLRAVIHSPDLAARWSRLGEYLRYSTLLPPKLNELAIIVTGRRWNSQVEFHVHAEAARAAGLDPACIEAIRVGAVPHFPGPEEREIYAFARAIHETGDVPDELHDAVKNRWGERGVVELTALIGYYTMVSIMLNVQAIPLMPGVTPPLQPASGGGFSSLPPAAMDHLAEAP